MNNDRNLMQQALEMIEDARNGSQRKPSEPVITALRERLAQPEQVPVAWMYDLKQRGSFEGVSTEYSRVKLSIGENWVPLYTAPPQRKPLSSEDIEQCCYEADSVADDHCQTWKWTQAFARAIEAAHGIGEKPDAA
jgi:hypothetical protein